MKKKFLVATALLAGSVVGTPALAAENPLDHAGIQHNMYLGCLMDLNATAEDALTLLVKKCGYAPGVPLERYIATQQPIVDSIDPTRSLTENLPALRQQFNAYEYSFLVRMDQIVENAADMDAAAAQFEALEREAIARLDPKSENGALILGGLSVARHSNGYWSKQAAESGVTSKGRFWKWLAVVVSDVGGYFLSNHDVGAAATVSSQAHDVIFDTASPTPNPQP
ncbi:MULTISPECIES: hypothetical protein [Xanthomonas]|uniref:Uncharacterized protein n=1 Tax=Xanthomonas rydalmerensis TaxID=3046274 RepID=A0ABZ0JLX6_9XANT|nr:MULTISPECIES: hypothetical protein [unclassified Xanthomonas]MBB5876998.1 hypothetical protein [Xanthomonas sp. 3498]MBB5941519.1 hypothetical protein [Xanthomonas sp. 3307]MXV06893.1 hypothetical protein [Xanthomonas sp. LMG 9002]WOS40162.1 hypothetical protein QN243_17440 [Xanthomonas sp. DM-2023]WOS44346.1 hypothetical protein QN242_17440 [Xanthomonas sp. DM-2023]